MNISGDDAIYYHINRTTHWSPFPKWNVGDVIDIGGVSNPYFQFFEEQKKTYTITTPDHVTHNIPGKHFLNLVQKGEVNCPDIAGIAADLTQHFVSYVRELIWEDVRKSEFPHLPSRQRCIWLAADHQGVKYWLQNLGLDGQEFQIAKVKVQGRIHIASNEHLLCDSEPMLESLKRARQYWLGIHDDPASREILFEGRLEILEFISAESLT
jgi:hypothetical protein